MEPILDTVYPKTMDVSKTINVVVILSTLLTFKYMNN